MVRCLECKKEIDMNYWTENEHCKNCGVFVELVPKGYE